MSSAKALVSACTGVEEGGNMVLGRRRVARGRFSVLDTRDVMQVGWAQLWPQVLVALWSLLPPELGLPWSPCSVLAGMKCGLGGQVYAFCCPQILALWGVWLQFKRFHLGSHLVLSQSIRQSWLGVSTVVLTVLSLRSETLQAHLWDKGKIWIWELYQFRKTQTLQKEINSRNYLIFKSY